jgi:hypothetical protein
MTRALQVLAICLTLCTLTRQAWGQTPGQPVFDFAVWIQSTITAIQSMAIVANQVIELTPLDELAMGDELQEDLTSMEMIIREGQALGWDLASLQAQIIVLFDLETAPRSSLAYRERMGDINRTIFQGYRYAMQTQTLIMTALRTIQHIKAILEHVSSAVGNLTASQTLGESQTKLTQLLTESNVQRAAFERAKSVEGLAPGVMLQGLYNINESIMEGHPR